MQVTLMIITYNWPEALKRVLDSALHQTMLPSEIVIGDDGSTDKTRQLIESYAQSSPVPIVHVWQEDKGFRRTSILNKAIARAKGDYIIQVDGDVILDSHFIADHVDVAQKGCFVCGSRVKLAAPISQRLLQDEEARLSLRQMPLSSVANSFRSSWLRHYLAFRYARRINHLRGCNMAYWKADAIRVNGYNEDLLQWGHEDGEFAYRLHFAGIRKKALKMGGIMYHLHHSEASKNNEEYHNQVLQQVIAEQRDRCDNGIVKYL